MVKSSYKLFRLAYQNNKLSIRKHLVIAILLEIILVTMLYFLNQIYGTLYAAIQIYDTVNIWGSIRNFTIMAMALVGVNGYLGYFINKLAFNIRHGLTDYYFNNQSSYPYFNNLEQRIQEDFKRFAESACDFWFAVLKALLYLPVFLGVIISLTEWYIGLSVVIAVAIGTVITKLVARRLITEQSIQEGNEANFRKKLTPEMFLPIYDKFQTINQLFKRLAFTQSGLSQLFVLMPFIILMPLYISKAIAMGAFFQAVNALGKIIDSLSILIDSRQTIVNIETCIVRLKFITEEK